jgi:putative ABC transport system permease protein
MEEDFKRQYQTEIRTRAILSVFSFLSLVIACLGLFGMVSFSAQKRTKEIGIRKSQGASVAGILVLLSRETIITMGIAAVLSFPVYFLIENWMQNFAFRIPFNPLIFAGWLIATVAFVLVLALISVSTVTVKAATLNPSDSLRYE